MASKKFQTPQVIFQPEVYQGMQRGIDQIANAIRPTLGPYSRLVAIESTIRRDKSPELLDSGGLIARRIIQLQDRDADMGAMLLRQMLWQLHEDVGDGTASAATIFQVLMKQGVRYIAAGGNAMRLRACLEAGAQLITDELERMTVPISGVEKLTQLAQTLTFDPDLAGVLGEIFDRIGRYGQLDIRPGRGNELEREYYAGMFWEGGPLSRISPGDSPRARQQLDHAGILISDLEIEEPFEMLALLALAVSADIHSVLLVANKISDRALSVLQLSPNREKVRVLPVKTPGRSSEVQWAALEDLSFVTGGQPILKAMGTSLRSVRLEQLGWAQQAWATQDHFGVVTGKGDPGRLEEHLACLRKAFASADDRARQELLRERIGKLSGMAATLWVGDVTTLQMERRKKLAERAARTLRLAMLNGVLPGGGVAYWDCCPVLQSRLEGAPDLEAHAAYRILIDALQAPMRALLTNAGVDSSQVIPQINQDHPGFGYDLFEGRVVDMLQAGILDSAAVAKAVILSAVHTAALALTTDVFVHRRNPPEVLAGT
jgi:chaperonin GroEL